MPTQEQAAKAWAYGNKGKAYYDKLTDEQKKAMWQYGYDRKLVDVNKLGAGAKAEYQRYVNPSKPEYAMQASIVQAQPKQYYQTQGEKLSSTITPSIVRNMVSQSPEQIIADQRRKLSEQRLEGLTPQIKPQIAQPQLPQQTNIRGKAVVQQGKVPLRKESTPLFDPVKATGGLALNTLSTINSVLQTPATMGKYGTEEMAKAKAEGKSPIGGLLRGYATGLGKAITNQDAAENIEVLEGVAPKTTTALKKNFPKTYNVASTIVNMFGVDDLTAVGLLGDIAKVRKLNQGINTTADLAKMSQAGIKDAEKVAKLMRENPDIVKAVDNLPQSELDNIMYVDPYGNVRKTPGMDLQLEAPKQSLPKVDEFKTLTKEIIPDAYHGSTNAKNIKEIKPSLGGELGEGFYYTKNKEYAKEYTKSPHAPTSPNAGVLDLNTEKLNIKEISKDEYLKERSKFYDQEQALNGGEWDANVAKRAEDKLIKKYESKGYDGLHVGNEQQGVVFPNSIGKIQRSGAQTLKPNKPIQSALDARLNKPQIAPSKNIDAPFRLTPAEQARIKPTSAEPKLTQSDLFKQPTIAQTPSSGINALPTAKTAGEPPIAKPGGIPGAEKPLSFPQTMKVSDNTAPELKKLIEDNPLSYKPINNPDTLKYAQELVDKNFDAAKALVKQGDNFNNATEAAMAQDVIRRMQNEAATNPAKWDEVFEVMEATSKKYKTAGQTVQTASMWSRMTPDGMLAYTKRVFDQANEVLPQASKVKLSPEIAQRITDTMTQIQSAPEAVLDVIRQQAGGNLPNWADNMLMSKSNEQLKDIAIAQVLADIGDKIPVSVARKISSVQAMGQLLNVKTFLRNILGNTSFSVVENISNTFAVPVDKALSKFTGKRSLALPQLKGSFKAGLDRAKESALDIKLGIDRTGVMEGKYNVPAGKTFKKGIGSTLEKTLKGTLNIPDEFAKGQIYDNVLKQQMKAANVTEATKEMTEYANYRALYGTFQDESFPARTMQAGKDFLNRVGVGKTIRGSSGQMTKEFGAGDLIIKYTRVPGNIISRAVEYTPAGLLKILSVGKNTKIANKQAEMAMVIGRAATGTTMIGLGAYLRNLGILQSEDKDRSKKALSLDRAEGLGNYKVNLTAIDRLLSNQDPTPQKGDELYSYNYLEPVSKAFALGAMIADEVGKGTGVFQKSYDIGGKTLDEILDLPTLTVLRKMTYQDDVFDVIMTPVTESAGGFVPSLMRQTAQTLDPTARETKGKSPVDTTINKVKANIPGLRQTLEPRVSPFGQEIKYPGGVVQNLINPSLKSVYTPSETTKKLKQLEDLTGENIQYPMDKAPAYVTEKKQKITLTPKEKTEYQKYAGQETEKIYKQLLLNKNLGNLSDAQLQTLVKSLQKANQDARDKAKMALIKKRK